MTNFAVCSRVTEERKTFLAHLIQPFPLEGHDDLDEDGDDPSEVNIAHNL